MRTGYVVGETIAGYQLDVATVLLEIGNAVRLKQYFDVGMLARGGARSGMRDPMLTGLDLSEFQPRNRSVVDPPLELGSFHRIDVELAAKIGQCF